MTSTTAAPRCANPLRVGLLTSGQIGGSAGGSAAWGGLQEAERDRSLCVRATLRTVDPGSDAGPSIQRLIADQNGLIMTADLILADSLAAAAGANPARKFALIDVAAPRSASNLISLDFRTDQAGYLAGALAGLMTRTNVVGGVYGLEITSIHRYRAGFESGVRNVNPVIAADPGHRLLGAYQAPGLRPFEDPDWGRRQAQAMLARGADIIFGAGGSTGIGALEAAAAAGARCISAGSDAYQATPGLRACLLTSAVTSSAVAVHDFVRQAAAQHWPSTGVATYDLTNGGVGLAPYHAHDGDVSPELRARIEQIQAELKSGVLSTGA